jgi:hypothetical protein
MKTTKRYLVRKVRIKKMMITEKQINRFWSYVDKSDNCWTFTNYKDRDGYGIFYAGKHWRAHRFSALIAGKDMTKPYVLHKCHTPSCVRPDHLDTGTQKDNMDDMIISNRQNLGHGGRKKIPVITPLGKFECIKYAAKAHQIDSTTVNKRIKDKVPGWSLSV